MTVPNGNKRVIIAHVMPAVAQGAYPAKAAEGEPVLFSADAFTDGHDEIGVSLLLQQTGQKKKQEYPMRFVNNDHWELELSLDWTGLYKFSIIAWIDHFTTWKKGLLKKQAAGQPLEVELQIGAAMLEKAAASANTNDKGILKRWIGELTQPGNITGAVSLAESEDLARMMGIYRDRAQENYSPTFTIEVERKKAAFSTWYELFPRSASTEAGRHGTFKDVKALLPRIAQMGFDVLYLPPIHPIGEQHRKGRNNALDASPTDPGSPWAIGNSSGGHKAINKELGTLRDFKDLVKAASKLDIEIALDIALQCSPDHPYVKEHPEWFMWRPDGTVQYAENPPKKYEDILPFHFETPDWKNLWEELKSIFEYWIAQGITVFRVDNPHTKPFAFWEWMIGEVRRDHPEVIFLAEAFTRPRLMERLAAAGFTQSYTYFTWRHTAKEIREYMRELLDMRYAFRPNFWPNTPDILTPFLTQNGETGHIQRLLLAATLSSSYGIYGPVYEFGLNTPAPGKEEYIDSEKYEIRNWDWSAYTRTGEIITLVNRIRREHPALQTTWNITFAECSNEQLLCYIKHDKATNDRLIIAVNLDPHNTQGGHVRIPIGQLGIQPGQAYAVHDLLSDDRYRWQDEWNYIELRPHEMPAHIFNIEKI